MKAFGLKFIDVMIGVILGLGFQWWPNLQEPWQYLAFIFVYLSIIDYWIDTAAALKKYPPKRELDLMLDIAILFLLFLYIYAAQRTVLYLLTVFVVARVLDSLWVLRVFSEYQLTTADRHIFDTWLRQMLAEVLLAIALIGTALLSSVSSLTIIVGFIAFRIAVRILASFRYKRVYFA